MDSNDREIPSSDAEVDRLSTPYCRDDHFNGKGSSIDCKCINKNKIRCTNSKASCIQPGYENRDPIPVCFFSKENNWQQLDQLKMTS